jgi:aspartate-semialdehyde dehydrogenase
MINIAIAGATGNVGREILRTIESSSLKTNKVFPLASMRSVGKLVSFGDKDLEVQSLESFDFNRADIVFFATESDISKNFVTTASKKCKLVIDLSSHFRMHDDIPLVVPEVNPQDIRMHNIIANPNCVAIPVLTVMKELHEQADIKKLILSTYQSVSGAGKIAMDQLYDQSKNKIFNAFSELDNKSSYAFNLVPFIDDITDSGYTKEEDKIMNEIQKVLSIDIKVSATCVRVPVFIGHSISLNVEFNQDITTNEARKILEKTEGVTVSGLDNSEYFTPLDCVGQNEVLVSRIRQDESNSLNMWIVADNLKKGAALNAVQIAQKFIAKQ